jgi:hypothetical protein
MIAEIPSGAFEIPDYALWALAGWVLSCLISGSFAGWFGYRLGLRAQEAAAIRADKLQLIPLIETFISKAENYPVPNVVRGECVGALRGWHLRFRIHLNGRRLHAFNAAWEKLQGTTETEMIGPSGQAIFLPDQAKEHQPVKQVLISRLQALLECVKRA